MGLSTQTCIIIVPIYRAFTELESCFVKNNLEKTQQFTTCFIGPVSCKEHISHFNSEKVIFEVFEDSYFKSVRTYNQLMLNEDFYKRFEHYEYMLIVQPDAYLFKNELSEWCEKGFDYIGAPWLRYNKLKKGKWYWFIYKNTYQKYLKNKRKGGWLYNKVGNGGLSLRKISTFLDVLKSMDPKVLGKYRSADWDELNEDVFWSIEACQKVKSFRIPSYETAMRFSLEQDAKNGVEILLKGELPFGCHDPVRQNIEFWKRYIPCLATYINPNN